MCITLRLMLLSILASQAHLEEREAGSGSGGGSHRDLQEACNPEWSGSQRCQGMVFSVTHQQLIICFNFWKKWYCNCSPLHWWIKCCHLCFILDKAQVYPDKVLETGSTVAKLVLPILAVGRGQVFTAGQTNYVGHLYLVDWTQDWTVGLDYGTGLRQSCAHHFGWLKQHIQLPLTKYASF